MARQDFPPALPALAQRPEGKQPEHEKPPEPSRTEKTSPFAFGKTSWFRSLSGWFSSTIVHLTILVLLAAFTLPHAARQQTQELFSSTDSNHKKLQAEEKKEKKAELDLKQSKPEALVMVEDQTPFVPKSLSMVDDVAGAPTQVEMSQLGFEKALPSNLLATVGAITGTELGGRGQKSRGRLLTEGGGNMASERAVSLGLKWIAEHQMPDGGWSFRIDLHPKCHGQCQNSGYGYASARTAATGLALMPFLSAGETHQKGKYQKNVERGLKFLLSQMNPRNGYLGGTSSTASAMYSHGIASIVLCEAYAMTGDKFLLEPAQKCIDYICQAQDPIGGGWRYGFQEEGDTSIVGWQLMALKSAQLAKLKVPEKTLKEADKFLDFVQSDDGARYGYMTPSSPTPTRTSIGLLCRMYSGWQKNNLALKRGVQLLSQKGPSVEPDDTDAYYNYYATQVMHHWGGKEWEKWNQVMRDHLIKTQAKKGHERGSWFSPFNAHGQNAAGRLYCTCMNVMILEIYYRYMPLYQKKSTSKKFSAD